MDGENCSAYRDGIHARSISSKYHASRDWVKALHTRFQMVIEFVVKNMYATHSIAYTELESYFYGFSIWNREICLDVQSTDILFTELNIVPVTVLYAGEYNETVIRHICEKLDPNKIEGCVLRNADEFHINNFSDNVVKFVRANHVQTDSHWMHKYPIITNKLKNK